MCVVSYPRPQQSLKLRSYKNGETVVTCIVCLIAMRQSQIEVFDVNLQIWKDQLNDTHINQRKEIGTLFLISCQMILVISSPSISTTGFFTTILGRLVEPPDTANDLQATKGNRRHDDRRLIVEYV